MGDTVMGKRTCL